MQRMLDIRAARVFAVLLLALGGPPTRVWADFSQNFEVDTSGWFSVGSDTVNQEPDGYVSPDYASGISSASPTHHARLRRGACGIDTTGGGGPTVMCEGPFTRWGGYNSVWMGGYTTQVDIYLDVTYAKANPDSYPGNIGCLTANSSDTSCNGTRFDFSSAINDNTGNFLQDYVFSVGTGDPSRPTPCSNGGWVVVATTNAFRSGTNIYDPSHNPLCVANSGWYTFKHTFSDVGGFLQVLMQVFPLGGSVPLQSWTITPGHAIANVGCNRYGWFAEQEIWDLPIDNSIMVGCGVPATTTSTSTSTSTTTLPDHFQCYEVDHAKTNIAVSLTNQFGTGSATLTRIARLCNPADKNGEDPNAPGHPGHMVGYTLRQGGRSTRVSGLSVKNQFGTFIVTVTRPMKLLVPSAKSLTTNPAPPLDSAVAAMLDHFECYKAKGVRGGPTVTVQDQFGMGQVNLLTPAQLCVAVDKNHEGIPNPVAKLVCYRTRLVSGTLHGPSSPVFVNNQFGPNTLPVVGHADEFCVPSSPSGAFLDSGGL